MSSTASNESRRSCRVLASLQEVCKVVIDTGHAEIGLALKRGFQVPQGDFFAFHNTKGQDEIVGFVQSRQDFVLGDGDRPGRSLPVPGIADSMS